MGWGEWFVVDRGSRMREVLMKKGGLVARKR